MNERIQELAQDCAILGEKEFAGRIVGFNYEKFAELIVRECIDIVGKNTASPNGVQALIKHFGVEE